ncbi:hypothetical protein RRG08_051524 [Elysia crispata]|uniref:Uncharacterized protein n=1 Tax=Elysia crispata TaxID=231223 RepID=A0AAE1D434_9GAST|nr:hypothetical protein RRG08_051524 [Elysia crispata]
MASRMEREKNPEYKKFVGLKKTSMQSFKEYLKKVEERFLNADLNSDKLLKKANTFLLNLKIPETSDVETSTNNAVQEQQQQQSPDVTHKRYRKEPQDKFKSPNASTSSSTSADIGSKLYEPVKKKQKQSLDEKKKNLAVKKNIAKNENVVSITINAGQLSPSQPPSTSLSPTPVPNPPMGQMSLPSSKYRLTGSQPKVASSPTSTSSGTSTPASKPTQNWHPNALMERRHFSVSIEGDTATPDVTDVKLLPEGLIVIADTSNCCVKLFNTQGRYIFSLKFDHPPVSLVVFDTEAKKKWEVGVSVQGTHSISILEVTSSVIRKLYTIETKRKCACQTLAAIERNSLAVGYQNVKGIDSINMAGNITLTLSPNIKPSSLAATVDGCKIMCTSGSEVVRLSSDGRELFKSEVSPIKKPSGITILRDKLIIADKKNLHLAKTTDDDRVTYIHKLWSLPDDMNSDSIESVSTDPEICVCSTKSGIVFVLDNVLWITAFSDLDM